MNVVLSSPEQPILKVGVELLWQGRGPSKKIELVLEQVVALSKGDRVKGEAVWHTGSKRSEGTGLQYTSNIPSI